MRERRKILIEGAVQGVGFRPFIYNLAARLDLSGYVTNTPLGVTIEVQGESERLERFIDAIKTEHPPLARPVIVSTEKVALSCNVNVFEIRVSERGAEKRAVITPDAATCADCLRELADPKDRRFQYPFINCTNCGPRYTITFDVPYDRPNTTMRVFEMCPVCLAEYKNPANRRFHAQPNACPVCGPRIFLTDARGKGIEEPRPMDRAIRLLEEGKILAVKGLGGFHLAVRADSEEGVGELRRRKYRKAKAFAVMVRNLEAARRLAGIDEAAERLLTGVERPIVLCPKRPGSPLSEQVAPHSRFWGIMLPYTPLHTLLLSGNYPALIMTSGNATDEPIEHENLSAVGHLGDISDCFLMHNRDIFTSCDDSVAKTFRGSPMLIRRARGFVPRPVPLRRRWDRDILAVGAELKNTVTFVKGAAAYTSQHIGDLSAASTFESFKRTVEKLGALIDARPGCVACDLHPAMLSTRFAESYEGVKLVRVQHHHAHIAAVMGERALDGPVIGLSADGVGYGDDGTVWGCEVLLARRESYERLGHLEALFMPGGDAASREPWRMAVSCLVSAFGNAEGTQWAERLLGGVAPAQIRAVAEMIARGVNSPATTSLGRLFDAVSALVGVCAENTYEAQAAIELESYVDEKERAAYPVEVTRGNGRRILAVQNMIRSLAGDVARGASRGEIAAKFHNFVVNGLAALTCEAAVDSGIRVVALAGGVFQNDILLDRVLNALEERGLQVHFNRELPINDGSISFGQAVVADAILTQGGA